MVPEGERFDAKVTVLIESVRHHVREEESEYFREVRSELGSRALNELGEAWRRPASKWPGDARSGAARTGKAARGAG